jgi:hypothetical protein
MNSAIGAGVKYWLSRPRSFWLDDFNLDAVASSSIFQAGWFNSEEMRAGSGAADLPTQRRAGQGGDGYMAKLDEFVRGLRTAALEKGESVVAAEHQGVGKERVLRTLRALDVATSDTVDAVYALLDPRPTWFSALRHSSYSFADGATTAHIACHVGILQRDGTKLDREGRDYWVKPLRELGIVEPVYMDPRSRAFVAGHPVPKSPNSAYSLNPEFVEVLMAPEENFEAALTAWGSSDARLRRARMAGDAARASRDAVETHHHDLIQTAIEYYVPEFLPGFEVLYVDDSDGERMPPAVRRRLEQLGLSLDLGDAWPDVLLWNERSSELWVIEAVTSDGEVDQTKVDSVLRMARRAGIKETRFTTVYPTWKLAAQRQQRVKNLAAGTMFWIVEDPTREFLVSFSISDFNRKVSGQREGHEK